MAEIPSKKKMFDVLDFATEYMVLPIYFLLIVVLNLGYVSIIFGYNYISIDVVNIVKQATEILIGISLTVNFSPWRTLHVTTSDAHIIFAAGTFLIFNVLIENAAIKSLLKDSLGLQLDRLKNSQISQEKTGESKVSNIVDKTIRSV